LTGLTHWDGIATGHGDSQAHWSRLLDSRRQRLDHGHFSARFTRLARTALRST
jgi:hypothetical protein